MEPISAPAQIAGFRIEGLLAQGGMSRVYVARQLSVDRRVALKVFETVEGARAAAIARLNREAHVLARLDHPAIVRCIDFGAAEGRFWLALELVEGESLKQRLDRGALAEAEAAEVTETVARALQHAHELGIVHRDVKPGNVLLARDGRVKLTDFGLARATDDLELTQAGTTIGTPQYLSPEQARSPKTADARSDLYSLGATLYHMLTGRPPFAGETIGEVITAILFHPIVPPERLVAGLDAALSRIVARLMARDPARRYPSAAALLADLEAWKGRRVSSRVGISWQESQRRAPGIARAWPWLVAAGVVVLGGLLAWSPWAAPKPPPAPPSGGQGRPFAASDLRAGRIDPLAAWKATAGLAEADASALRTDVLALVGERATALAAQASAAARRRLTQGDGEAALAEFDRAVAAGAPAAFGATIDALPFELADAAGTAPGDARAAVEKWLREIRREADAALELAIEAQQRELSDRLAQAKYREAQAQLGQVSAALEAKIAPAYVGAVAAVIPGAQAAGTDPDFRTAALARIAALETGARALVERRIDEARAQALETVASFDPPPAPSGPPGGADAIGKALARTLAPILGGAVGDFPGEPGPVDAAIAARASALEREQADAAARERQALESEVAADLFEALSRRDFAAGDAAVARLQGRAAESAWLGTLQAGLADLEAAEQAVARALEASVGQKVKVATQSIAREGVLGRVDRAGRALEFARPEFQVRFDELAPAEIEARAGAALTPLARALLAYFAGDLAQLSAALDGAKDEPWAARLVELRDQMQRDQEAAAKGQASSADLLLAEFDAAKARGDVERTTAAADRLLRDFARVPQVRARWKELRRESDDGRASLDLEKRHQAVRAATRAAVTFGNGGQVELRYGFIDAREAEDFELPGAEWRVDGGRLESLSALHATAGGGARIDLFRNRPGIERALPFDPGSGARVELEVELPLECEPGLFGIRVLSTCFVIRSFPGKAYPGQVNAWLGELDEFAFHLFDPALGETRPRKASAGNCRSYSLERGNRYRIVVEVAPGAGGECRLTIEDEVVYRFKPEREQKATSLEIRAETPIAIDELKLTGLLSGSGTVRR